MGAWEKVDVVEEVAMGEALEGETVERTGVEEGQGLLEEALAHLPMP